jgi:hypothetical protein
VPRKPTGRPPGRPRKPNLVPETLPKPTKNQRLALLLERRVRFPHVERVKFSDLMEPEQVFHKGLAGLSTREMSKRLRSRVSHGTIQKYRHDAVSQQWFCKVTARAVGRKLRRRMEPITRRSKKEADEKLMKEVTEQVVAQQAAKRAINRIESPVGDHKPFESYDPWDFLGFIRRWKGTGSTKMQRKHPGWFTRALWHGDKLTEWFLSQGGDQEPEPVEGDWKFEPTQAPFDGRVEFFKQGNIDCIRITPNNPAVRTKALIGTFKGKGKSVRRRIAKRGDVLEEYEGKATPEHIKRYPKEWDAYQAEQRNKRNEN